MYAKKSKIGLWYKFACFFCLSIIFTSFSLGPTLQAMSAEQRDLHNSNIHYYDVDLCSGATEAQITEKAPDGTSVYILGDSIVEATADKVKVELTKKNSGATINASKNRSITGSGETGDNTSGLGAIQKDKDTPGFKNAAAIIIALGTTPNDDFKQSMTDLVKEVKKYNATAPIYWVNIFSRVPHRISANQAIESVASENSIRIINTAEGSIETNGSGSNEQLTNAGQQRYAETVATSVRFDSNTPAPSPIDESCCISATEETTVLPGKNNGEKIWNFLVNKEEGLGFSNTQAAGIMGNIKQESNYSPTALNSTSGAYGIVQWYAGRLTNLENFAKSQGKPKSNMGVQLQFLKKELEGSYKSSVYEPIKASTSLSQAVRIWLEKFEIPCIPGSGACDAEMNKRMPFAQSWVDGAGEGSADGSGSAPPSTGCSEETAEGSGEGKGEFVWPMTKSNPVLSCYGYARGRLHTGLDIAAPVGTTVSASDGGIVVAAGNTDPGGFGNTVIIKHSNGKWTLYAHLSQISVRNGQKLDQGQAIGKSGGARGAPGAGSSEGPHLHFNIQTAGGAGQGAVDPLKFLPKDGRSISGGDCPGS